jgi:hypothetical protein
LIGILTVPAAAAQDAANLMVLSGMRAIWNYTPVKLEVPDIVIVEDVKLAASLAVLSSRLAESLRRNPAHHLMESSILGPREPLTEPASSPRVEEAGAPVA